MAPPGAPTSNGQDRRTGRTAFSSAKWVEWCDMAFELSVHLWARSRRAAVIFNSGSFFHYFVQYRGKGWLSLQSEIPQSASGPSGGHEVSRLQYRYGTVRHLLRLGVGWTGKHMRHRLIDWSINALIDRSIDALIDWLIEALFDWSIDGLIDWVTEGLIGWSVDQLIDWLIDEFLDGPKDWSIGESLSWLIE